MTVGRRTVLRAAAAVTAPWLVRARAQTRARRIGVLSPWVDPGGPPPGTFAAWKKLGWIEGETLHVERRYAAWHMERMPELADELLRRQNVELLIAWNGEAAVAAARATRTAPIVFFFAYLPVECGLVDSYARPGRNATGIAENAGVEMLPKRMEFIRAIAPSAHRLAVLSVDSGLGTVSGAPLDVWPGIAAAAKAQGFEMTRHIARSIAAVESALLEAASARAQAAMISGHFYVGASSRVTDFALRQRWVTATLSPWLFDAGLLLYHGPSAADTSYVIERGLQMVDLILRGATPAEIPVEMPSHIEFAINLKTARALGITLPHSLLLRADRVVE
ncbi:MAG TPA: ABC transporter substrate-binding protein [Burkholderiaceae bacterium]|nr:ABC transporter substrate-binding protein [Burkholderiaceae bacterium]